MRTGFALLLRLRALQEIIFLIGDERKRLVQPLATHTELVLTGIHGKTKALLGGFTPDATALLLQARATIGSFVARHGALI